MLRTNVYLTEEQERELNRMAAVANKAKAEILREVIDKGLSASPVQKSASTSNFMKLSEIAREFKDKGKGPRDLSANLDKYTWDE